MTERSLFWEGVATGDHGPYTQAHLMDRFFRCILNGTGNRGVLKGWSNELEVSGTSSPVSVNTGAGIVYGLFYTNDSAVTVTIPTPSSGKSRYDRVILRRSWSTQQIRVARVSGVAAVIPSIPAMTQTAGSTWDIPLATILINDAGVITITDAREYCAFPSSWAANIVGPGMYEEGAITTDQIPNRSRYDLRGAGQIEPDSSNPFVWTAGGSYDYWEATDAATTAGWVNFMGPDDEVSASVDIYVWSVPDVNGAGGGAENCHWDYSVYYGASGGALTNATGHIDADQQARVNTTVYADQLISGLALGAGQILVITLSRDGAADSYNSDMRLLGIEMRWTADA